LPNVAVHDLVVQPEAKHLVLGTHGRSMYVADISLLQKITAETMDDVIISEVDSIDFSPRWGRKWGSWGEVYEPKASIQFYSPQSGKATISIKTADGDELQTIGLDAMGGVNVLDYDLSISEKSSKL